MNMKTICTALALFCLIILASACTFGQAPDNSKVKLVDDLPDSCMEYRNFRLAQDEFRDKERCSKTGGKTPSRDGLTTLRASGSSEFSKEGLAEIIGRIPASAITVVDLREESHGFINDRPVSWEADKNAINKGKNLAEIVKDEKTRLDDEVKKRGGIRSSYNEEELCRKLGVKYIRIPVTDFSRPEDSDVDYFIDFVRTLPPDTWLHFHCKAGAGRTTTFMVLYDMMRNADKVSYEDIVVRQYIIGGSDLSGRETKGDAWFDVLARERNAFVKEFYRYCRDNRDGFRQSWSEWKKKN